MFHEAPFTATVIVVMEFTFHPIIHRKPKLSMQYENVYCHGQHGRVAMAVGISPAGLTSPQVLIAAVGTGQCFIVTAW